MNWHNGGAFFAPVWATASRHAGRGVIAPERDIDVFVEPSRANAARLLGALTGFGFGTVGLRAADFTSSVPRSRAGARRSAPPDAARAKRLAELKALVDESLDG